MAVGDSSLQAFESYIAIGRETAYGTYNTASSSLEFLSSSLRMLQESKLIEQIETSRTYSKQIRLGKTVEGEVEMYAYGNSTAFNYLLASGFAANTVTSATATGETAGGAALTHEYLLGSNAGSYTSLCINMRKGGSAGAQVFEYSGLRVNETNFVAEIDEALKCTFGLIGKDVSTTSNDVASALSTTALECLNFIDGRISVEAGSLGAVTSTSFWHVQNMELGISNSLKADAGSRRIGSSTLDVLPVGIAQFTLNLTIRFDTSTAYDAMLANTNFAAVCEFQGNTIGTSSIRHGLKFSFPKMVISDAGDPEIGGPDEMLTSQVSFHILRDISSASGYAIKAEVTNDTANYL